MINITKKLVILTSNSELARFIKEAIQLILDTFGTASKNFRTALTKIVASLEAQSSHKVDELLTESYMFITHRHGEKHHSQTRRVRLFFPTLTKTDIDPAKTILRVLFVYLHKNGAVMLSYNFTRPQGSITQMPQAQKLFYCETIHPFLMLESQSNDTPRKGKRIYTAAQRLWQTGIKSLLMTSLTTPEKLNRKDFQQLRAAQVRNNKNQIIPIPVIQICQTLSGHFASRINNEFKGWVEAESHNKDSRQAQYDQCETMLLELLEENSSPFEMSSRLAKYRRFGVSSFCCDTLDRYRLDVHIHQGWDIFKTSMDVWTKAEQSFIDHQSPEKMKSIRLGLGKVNLYLFVYLPLWVLRHPLSEFKYPSSPAKFTSSIHFNCDAPLSSSRPLSLCELFRDLGYKETYSSQAEIRVFFNFLIEFGADLKGCFGVKQPVRRMPASKKYTNVTKNVFTGEQLRQLIAYHNALETAADFFFEQSRSVYAVAKKAIENNSHIDTVDLGFVPIMYHHGKISYIRRLHPDSFHFVEHDHQMHYNPGSVRFSLLLLESGVRGQTLQWLDATSYDRISHRLSRDSLQLTSLWLNTDKIQKTPLIIVTSMSNLWLLDAQRRWRKTMIEGVGVNGFDQEIFYDHEPKSHWGKIRPLFAANPVTGDPFTDGEYTNLWNYHCLNFQNWYKENTDEQDPIIGFLPLRKNSDEAYFAWEDWIEGIIPEQVLTLPGSAANRVYQANYCPVSLRAYSTPHGARASFVTDFSVNLPPEAVAMLTGQSINTIIKYNKGHALLRERLKGAFNNRDADWYLTYHFAQTFSMANARDLLEDSIKNENLGGTVETLGLHSFPTSTSPREMTGLKLIATDRSLSLGACYTHICPYNFICPDHILLKFDGQKRCAQCPFAIFSSHNLPAIEARRQKEAEEYQHTCKIADKYLAQPNVPAAEKHRVHAELKNSAKDVISWMLMEELLWAKVEMQQEGTGPSEIRDLVVSETSTVVRHVTRAEYNSDSVEGFLSRLDSACIHPESVSKSLEFKIDRATRLLMINNNDVMGAAMMPSSFPNALRLAGMIRSSLQFDSIDIEQLVKYVSLDDAKWAQALLSFRPSKNTSGD